MEITSPTWDTPDPCCCHCVGFWTVGSLSADAAHKEARALAVQFNPRPGLRHDGWELTPAQVHSTVDDLLPTVGTVAEWIRLKLPHWGQACLGS